LLHSSVQTGLHALFHPGDYTAIIESVSAQIDGKHRGDVRIQHLNRGVRKVVQFLNKGSFTSVIDAKSAYEGLSLSFRHDGGSITVWLPSLIQQQSSGQVQVLISPTVSIPPQEVKAQKITPEVKPQEARSTGDRCTMTVAHLSWYEKSWAAGDCCGLVVTIMGQDYIVVKRSLGNEMNCGGGETELTPCIARFLHKRGHPAFAWPTFDGKTFAPLPQGDTVEFQFDEQLNDLVTRKIENGDFTSGKGSPAGVRHLSYQLPIVLFPVTNG
jgi:hypothetical protein